jgi:hypothetical protein
LEKLSPLLVETMLVDAVVEIIQEDCDLVASDSQELDQPQLELLSARMRPLEVREKLHRHRNGLAHNTSDAIMEPYGRWKRQSQRIKSVAELSNPLDHSWAERDVFQFKNRVSLFADMELGKGILGRQLVKYFRKREIRDWRREGPGERRSKGHRVLRVDDGDIGGHGGVGDSGGLGKTA